MAKSKAHRPKARLPRGFADRTPAEIRRTAQMMETIRTVYERWGFEPIETPLIEYADALGKFLPDQDRPNEGVFAFQDDDDEWLSLRYDLTAPLARMVAQNYDRLPKPYKSYRSGWVFRNEKPGPGRFRQFMQFDADIVGAASPLADAEICMMAADTMEALGFARGEYRIRVNSREFLDGALELIGISNSEITLRTSILRSIDKLDRLGTSGVADLLGNGRKDESGTFTPGCKLDRPQIDVLLALLEVEPFVSFESVPLIDGSTTNVMTSQVMFRIPSIIEGNLEYSSKFESVFRGKLKGLCDMKILFLENEYDEERISVDFSVVRGLEYYTGPVFEAELTFPIIGEDGREQRFGSVGGGGRYDGLVGRFRGENVPATGFSVGVSRLAAALEARDAHRARSDGPIIVTVMDRDNIGEYQKLTADLRAALNTNGEATPVEMYIGDSGMKAQLKYADRRNSPCVIIQGSDERARGKVQIKDLAAGKAASETIEDRAEWVAARPAQQEVDANVDSIAAAVRAILS